MISRFVLNLLLSDGRFKLVKQTVKDSHLSPLISCVIPVFNQESVVYKHLRSIVEHSTCLLELIILDDTSSDDTTKEILRFINDLEKSQSQSNILGIRFYRTSFPVYESRCEDFGFRNSNGRFVMSIQADMKILELGFDRKLIQVFESDSSLRIISCRGVHSLSELGTQQSLRGREHPDDLGVKYFYFALRRVLSNFFHFSKNSIKIVNISEEFNSPHSNSSNGERRNAWASVFPNVTSDKAGWLGTKIDELPYEYDSRFHETLKAFLGRLWIGDSVMRGPLLMKRDFYIEMGGFDVAAFYQGLDDHDLSLRVKSVGGVVGFSPIYFSSPIELGAGRFYKSFRQRLVSTIHAQARRTNFENSALYKKLNYAPKEN